MKLVIKSYPSGDTAQIHDVVSRAEAVAQTEIFLRYSLTNNEPERRLFPAIRKDLLVGSFWEITLEDFVPTIDVGMLVRRVDDVRRVARVVRLDTYDERWLAYVPRHRWQWRNNHSEWIHSHRMMLQVCIDGVWHDPYKHERDAFFNQYPDGVVR